MLFKIKMLENPNFEQQPNHIRLDSQNLEAAIQRCS